MGGLLLNLVTNPITGMGQNTEVDLTVTIDDKETVKEQFRQIYKAIQSYRQDHKDKLPDWLSDLYPQYLTDTNLLVSSYEKRTGKIGPFHMEDPKIHTSFNYEFNALPASRILSGERARKMTMKEWKLKLVETFGPVTPLVRFMWENGSVNLTYGGDLYESGIGWEGDGATQALLKKLRAAGQLKVVKADKYVALTVTDADGGKGLGGVYVRVEISTDLGWQPVQEWTTDAEGKCRIDLPENTQSLTVGTRKKGYADRDFKYTQEQATVPSITVALAKGVSVQGVVLNSNRQPISGVRVYIPRFYEKLTTDAEGRWRFDRLPADYGTLEVEFSHPYYRDARISSSADSIITQLRRPFIIQGTVTDSGGEALDAFAVWQGYDHFRGVRWNRAPVLPGREGKFKLRLDGPAPNFLKVQSPDFQSAVSTRLVTDEGELPLPFELTPGIRLFGNVVLDDRPLAGVEVALLTESDERLLGMASLNKHPGETVPVTDSQGKFTVCLESEVHSVVFVHPQGFAGISADDLARSSRVVLKPWSKLEARLLPPGRRNNNQTLVFVTAETRLPSVFNGPHTGTWALDFEAYSQEILSGNPVVFEAIPPGERVLWHALRINDSGSDDPGNLSFVGTRFIVKPGETARLQPREKDIWQMQGKVLSQRPLTWNAVLGVMRFKPAALESQETELASQEIALTFGADGSFRVDGLPPALSEVELRVYEPPVLCGSAKINLRPISPTAGNDCWDVGTVEMTPIKAIEPGAPVPDFGVAALNGQSLKLSDYRGKYVLVEFWSSWSQPSLSSVPFLKTVHEKYGPTGKCVVLGLNLDADLETARSFATRLHMNWPQGALGSWLQTSLLAQLGARSVPAAFLIDPAGRLVAANLSGPDICRTIERLLNK
jgi:peroxiredoxin